MIAGELLAICPADGSMPTVPSAPVFVCRVPLLARLRLARRRRFADIERHRVVDGERHERKAEALHQVDDAVLAELRIGLARLRVEDRQVIARRDDDDALVAPSVQ